jgi:hypothetical protein
MKTVIGGGLAGLTAAIALAKNGAKVRLVEHARNLGGRAMTNLIDGFRLNLGPHALYLDGCANQTLTNWGISPPGEKPDVAGRSFLVYRGEKHNAPLGLKDLVVSSLFTVGEKLDAGNALRKLSSNIPPDPNLSVSQWLEAEVRTEKVRQLILTYVRVSTYSNQPELMSAQTAFRQFQMAAKSGVRYIDGGWQTMIDQMAEHARELGVRIETGVEVKDIPAGAILAIPPQQVTTLTGMKFDGILPMRMACLDLGLTELPPDAAAFALGVDEPIYYSVHSLWAKMAKGPQAVVHIGKYLGASTGTREELEHFADILMPGWRERVLVARFLPEMTVAHTGVWVNRPRPDVRSVPGVFIAGDWVGNRGMLADAAVASGLEAAAYAA